MVSHTTLEELFGVLARAAASGRIGRPCAVRGTLELSADHGRLAPLLARGLSSAFESLAEAPVRLHAAGSIATGSLTVLAEGENGTTALLAAAVLRAGPPRADFLVLGSRGSLLFEGDANAAHLELADEALQPAAAREPAARERSLLAALERSLAERAPVAIRHAGGGEKQGEKGAEERKR